MRFWRKNSTRFNIRGIATTPHLPNPLFPKQKPKRFFSGRGYYYTIIVLIGLTYFLFFSSLFKISSFDIQGLKYIQRQQVEDPLNQFISHRRWLLFPGDNLIIFSSHAATKALQQAVGTTFALETLEIVKRFPATITVKIREKIPDLTWITQNGYYYLDLHGVVTRAVAQSEIDPTFPVIHDQSNLTVSINEQVIDVDTVNIIFELQKKLTEKTSLEIDSFIIPTEEKKIAVPVNANSAETNGNLNAATVNGNSNGNTNEVNSGTTTIEIERKKTEVWVATKNGPELYFNTREDLDRQISNLETLLKEKFKPEDLKSLYYIDLRIGDRVYYK